MFGYQVVLLIIKKYIILEPVVTKLSNNFNIFEKTKFVSSFSFLNCAFFTLHLSVFGHTYSFFNFHISGNPVYYFSIQGKGGKGLNAVMEMHHLKKSSLMWKSETYRKSQNILIRVG